MVRKPRKVAATEILPDGRVFVQDEDLWPLLLFALRYALGRRSYAPGLVCDMFHRYVKYLTHDQCVQIAKEIRAEAETRLLGYEDQHKAWIELATWLEVAHE